MNVLVLQLIFACSPMVVWSSSRRHSEVTKLEQLNSILQCDGWKEISNLRCDYYDSEIQTTVVIDVEKLIEENDDGDPIVTPDNFDEKFKQSLIVMTSIYYSVLYPLYEYHGTFGPRLRERIDSFNVFNQHKFIKAARLYYPLITCMIRTLDFFNYPSPLLATLENLKIWYDAVDEVVGGTDFMHADPAVYQELYTTNAMYGCFEGFSYNYSVYGTDHHYVANFIGSITDTDRNGQRRLCVHHPSLRRSLERGVELFCHDFGFNDQILNA